MIISTSTSICLLPSCSTASLLLSCIGCCSHRHCEEGSHHHIPRSIRLYHCHRMHYFHHCCYAAGECRHFAVQRRSSQSPPCTPKSSHQCWECCHRRTARRTAAPGYHCRSSSALASTADQCSVCSRDIPSRTPPCTRHCIHLHCWHCHRHRFRLSLARRCHYRMWAQPL